MGLAEEIARDVASRYSGGSDDSPPPREESPVLRFSGQAMDAVARGDRAAFAEAIAKMLDARDQVAPTGDVEFDPDTLE